VHIMDDQGFGRFAPIVPVDVPTGWECPRCQRVYSPQTGQCVPCSPPPQSFAGLLPRPKPGLFPLDLPQPVLIPVDVPTPTPPGKPETCCVCRGPEVVYRNYADLPFCRPCANGEPLGNLTPCQPSADGGLCGCSESDDDPLCASCPRPRSQHADTASFRPRGPEKPNPRTATPPAYLAGGPNGVRLVRLTGDWAEIFTGMQARFLDEGRIQADVEFRLTPADGETGD
jgi:hypothetical protein